MSKKKKKQSIAMEDHGSLRYRDGKGKKKDDFFDRSDYEISSILLQLSHPVIFSSDSPLFHKWGRTKKRSSFSIHLHPPEPVMKSLPCTAEVGDMGSNSSSSCLTGEAKKANSQIIKKGLEAEFCKKNQSSSVLEADTGLLRAHVGLIAQPIRCDQHLPFIAVDRTVKVRDFETASLRMDNLERRGFDLNLPAAEEGFQRVANKVQVAAQARQRRLGLIRSKKLYNRFISSYQLK
ncbi:uncharacterized protein LOC9325107 isoform X3 [Arabidopsis lyrata subsp. lyrata]|uniref:uncharacterized protein LOC9325107 isoform X3 n=1 Tax=Arabidopsis lyrata subsp. lyrata TaxID=81972 RepID=UPI000A29B227|nr:uncharacterized protein LOC9325107 isoform X3 [Arabidopsis lyrata subsp. lyrata]|eukprot:XP_020890675.1 uncharacterized protein LOC9325107 isoform X3 [Arabidopsis lyrata subsp. lyrata]